MSTPGYRPIVQAGAQLQTTWRSAKTAATQPAPLSSSLLSTSPQTVYRISSLPQSGELQTSHLGFSHTSVVCQISFFLKLFPMYLAEFPSFCLTFLVFSPVSLSSLYYSSINNYLCSSESVLSQCSRRWPLRFPCEIDHILKKSGPRLRKKESRPVAHRAAHLIP